MQVTMGTRHMHKQCVPESLFSSFLHKSLGTRLIADTAHSGFMNHLSSKHFLAHAIPIKLVG